MKSTHIKNTKLILTAIAVIIISCSFKFSHISLSEGLSQGIVVSSCQDSLGHMWFATHDGLNRYDGYRFTIYKNNPQDSTTIADNLIRKVYIDSKGDLWIGTEKGLSFYDKDKDIFHNFGTEGKAVTGIADIDETGMLIIAAGGSIRIFDTDKHLWLNSAPPVRKKALELQ